MSLPLSQARGDDRATILSLTDRLPDDYLDLPFTPDGEIVRQQILDALLCVAARVPAFLAMKRDNDHPVWTLQQAASAIRDHVGLVAGQANAGRTLDNAHRVARTFMLTGKRGALCLVCGDNPPFGFTCNTCGRGGSGA